MNNNDIFRQLRYAFDFRDQQIIKIFKLAEYDADLESVINWLKKDEDPQQKNLHDKILAIFLNGFIILKRGKKDGPMPPPEKNLNNNQILRKLKIALTMTDDQMVAIFDLVDFEISKHEINAFFRKPTQSQYRECKDQFLRNFLFGIQKKFRPDSIKD